MSRLQELIAELCSDGVEYRALGEVCEYPKSRVSSDDLDLGAYVSVENLAQDFRGLTGEVATTKPGPAAVAFEPGDVLVGNIRPYLKKVWLASFSGGTNGDVLVFRIRPIFKDSLLPEFLRAQLASDAFIDFDMKFAKGAKMPRGDKKAVLKYCIPVPPIEVQREVVRVLDEYTAAHDELVALLKEEYRLQTQRLANLRNYMCTKYLDGPCSGEVEYKALCDVGELVKGSGLQKKDFVKDGVGCIHYGQIHTRFGSHTDHVVAHVTRELASKLLSVNPGDVVVAVTSEDISACCKAVAWMGNEVVVTGGHSVVIRHGMNPKFLSYCFQTEDFYRQKRKYAAGVKVIEMRTDKLARIRIPVPPIEVQHEVVGILDEYTEAHDELMAQLGHENAALAQQLALIRNKLLSFPEKEA